MSETNIESILRSECNEISIYEKYKNKRKEFFFSKTLAMEEKEAFGDLIKQGVIMKCPECGICLERADSGCQMLRCFYCRLDICWLTKQARWGPGGKGDTSGGCRCGLNGVKCHPDCKNCH